jgi:hypothetical protein
MRYKFVLSLLCISALLVAQNDSLQTQKKDIWKNISIGGMFQKGWVFPTNDFFRYHNIEAAELGEFQHFSVKLSKQTTGDELWEQLYKYPNWGFGMSVLDFYNPTQIGVPIALYGFFNAPFVRWKRSSFNYELSFGPSFNWEAYNPIDNKYNVAIGAFGAFFIDAGMNVDFELGEHLDLITGFSLTHFSNGALKIPNSGINTIAPKVSLKYNLNERPKVKKQDVPKFDKKNELLVSTFIGAKNIVFNDSSINPDIIKRYRGLFYPVFGVTAIFNRQVSYKSKFGFGINIAYNSTVNAEEAAKIATNTNDFDPVAGPLSDKLQISIFPSYELTAHNISLILQPAFYIYRKKVKNQSPDFHQRVGLRYHVSDDMFVGITLRDYAFHVSDFIEWSVGYKIGGK